MKGNKVLFVHDGPVYSHNGSFYGVTINNALKERYLYLAASVTFLMRVKEANENKVASLTGICLENLKVVSIPDFKSFKKYLFNIGPAKRIIKREVSNHDIVVVRLPSIAGAAAVREARKQSKPILAEYVACTYDAYWNYGFKGKLIAHYKLWVQRGIVKKLSHIIYVTERFLQSRYPSDAIQTNCSNVELHSIDDRVLVERIARLRNKTNDKDLVMGTVAALDVKYKGQRDVIKAVAVLKKNGFNFKYKLVGHGNPEKLVKLAREYGVEDRVDILGPLKHSEVMSFYETIDVYIQPSRQEGLPRAVIEAMSKGCFVLGTDVAGIPELIGQKRLFKPGDVKHIAALLENVNIEELIREAETNFQKAKQYQFGTILNRRLNFYREFNKHYNLELSQAMREHNDNSEA